MKLADIPAKFRAPFAVAADPADIRPIPNTTSTSGAASLQAGFPPVCFVPVASGGVPPSGADFNGLFNQISAWSQWTGAGGLTVWDSTFSTQIGGYPKGALLSTNPVGGLWLNTTDDNTTNPDASGAGWINPLNLSGYALLASPHFTGVPTAPTATGGTNTNQLATCAFVIAAVGGIGAFVSSWNGRTGAVTLTSLDVTGALGFTPANINSPTFTGIPAGPTAAPGNNTTQFATCAFVTAAVAAATTGVSSWNGRTGAVTLTFSDVTTALTYTPAPLVSPAFSGVPTTPTAGPGDNSPQIASTAYVDAAVAALQALVMQPGDIKLCAYSAIPTGYLECNGAAIDRGVYANLFGVIGTTYGIGDGSTTFNLPDLRGEFVRGYDNGRGLDPGRVFGSSQADAFKAHIHTWAGGSNNNQSTNLMSNANSPTGVTKDSSSVGGSETRPVNVAMLYAIKY